MMLNLSIYSFYSTNNRVGYATFVPRIKLPTRTISYRETLSSCGPYWKSNLAYSISAMRIGDEWPNSIYDFENYDDSTFKPSTTQLASKRRIKQMKRPSNFNDMDFTRMFLRQNSEPEIHAVTSPDMYSSNSSILSSSLVSPSQPSSAITIPSKVRFKKSENVYSSSFGALNIECKISSLLLYTSNFITT